MQLVTARSLSLGVALVLLSLAACQWSENRFLERSVNASEIPGVWRLSQKSVEDLRHVGFKGEVVASQHEILLKGDGTGSFRSFPELPSGGGQVQQPIDKDCHWELFAGRRQELKITLEGQPDSPKFFFFDETPDHRLILWKYITDPDAWRYIEFIRQETSEP